MLTVAVLAVAGLAALARRAQGGAPVRRSSRWLWAAAIAVYAFLYVPLAVVVVFSFNDSRLNAEWVGFTLDWYAQAVRATRRCCSPRATRCSSRCVASLVATRARHHGRHRHAPLPAARLLPLLVLTPVAMPEILLGVSLLIFFISVFGQDALGLLTVDRSPTSRSASASSPSSCARGWPAWTRASSRRRATSAPRPGRRFRLVTLPLILPGGDRRLPDGLHAVDRRLRHHLLHRRRRRQDAAAADLLDDQDRR
ncbi:MAG: hypothetical protein MZV65_44250 [Chromatiales bacterium]|nr:hypothetical protein [Chromatiales bacterium]